MKPEDKDLKQGAELSEEELDTVAGGQTIPFTGPSTTQFNPSMKMGPSTLQYQPGSNTMNAQVLGTDAPAFQTCSVNPTDRENLHKL